MKTHNLNTLRHHVWQTADKINVYSVKQINKGDRLVLSGETVIVTKVEDAKRPNADMPDGTMFYELNVKKDE